MAARHHLGDAVGQESAVELAGVAVDAVALAELALRQAPAPLVAEPRDRPAAGTSSRLASRVGGVDDADARVLDRQPVRSRGMSMGLSSELPGRSPSWAGNGVRRTQRTGGIHSLPPERPEGQRGCTSCSSQRPEAHHPFYSTEEGKAMSGQEESSIYADQRVQQPWHGGVPWWFLVLWCFGANVRFFLDEPRASQLSHGCPGSAKGIQTCRPCRVYVSRSSWAARFVPSSALSSRPRFS